MLITTLQLAGWIIHMQTAVLSSLRAGWHLGIVIELTVHAVAWSGYVVTLKEKKRKENFTLFSNNEGSLSRRQPGVTLKGSQLNMVAGYMIDQSINHQLISREASLHVCRFTYKPNLQQLSLMPQV